MAREETLMQRSSRPPDFSGSDFLVEPDNLDGGSHENLVAPASKQELSEQVENNSIQKIRDNVMIAIQNGKSDEVVNILQNYLAKLEAPTMSMVQNSLDLLDNKVLTSTNEHDKTVEIIRIEVVVPVRIGLFDQVIKIPLTLYKGAESTLSIESVTQTVETLPEPPKPAWAGPDITYLRTATPVENRLVQWFKKRFK